MGDLVEGCSGWSEENSESSRQSQNSQMRASAGHDRRVSRDSSASGNSFATSAGRNTRDSKVSQNSSASSNTLATPALPHSQSGFKHPKDFHVFIKDAPVLEPIIEPLSRPGAVAHAPQSQKVVRAPVDGA